MKRFIRRATIYWFTMLAIVTLLAISSAIVLSSAINTQKSEAEVVNQAGRQRTYSQRIALYSLQLVNEQDVDKKQRIRAQLSASIDAMESVHNMLINSQIDTTELKAIYFAGTNPLDSQVKAYIATARRLSITSDNMLNNNNADLVSILETSPPLLVKLDNAVTLYQENSLDVIQNLQKTNLIRVALVVLVLVLQGIFIVRPVMRRLRRKAEQVENEISERIRIEQALRETQRFSDQITNTVPDHIYVFDMAEQRNIFINYDIGEMLGYNVEQIQAMGSAVMTLLMHPEDHERQIKEVARFYTAKEGDVIESEYRYKHANGEWRWLYTRDTIFSRNADSSPRQVLGVISDITDRKLLDQQKLGLQIEQERSKMLSDFVNNVSHEFRTPLTIISSSAYLLGKITDPERQKAKLSIIQEEIKHLVNIVEQLHAAAQLDATATFNMSDVTINLLIQNIEASMRQRTNTKNVHFQLNLSPDFLTVHGNEVHLYDAISALIDNAIRFTPPEGTITISTHHNTGMIIITVQDTGEGISPNDLPHIFEPLYKGNKARTSHQDGAGLGLSIVKKIVQIHGGYIEVESEQGSGAVFRILLPKQKAEAPITPQLSIL